MLEIVPEIPEQEKYDLKDQLSRSSKAVPRLIAEGYGKKHQRAGFQKYLDDAMTEVNETIVSLSHARDIYKVKIKLCDEAVREYDILGRQIYCLAEAWDKFKLKGRKHRVMPTNHDS